MAALKWLLLGVLALLADQAASTQDSALGQAHQLHIEEVQGILSRSGRQLSQTFGEAFAGMPAYSPITSEGLL